MVRIENRMKLRRNKMAKEMAEKGEEQQMTEKWHRKRNEWRKKEKKMRRKREKMTEENKRKK